MVQLKTPVDAKKPLFLQVDGEWRNARVWAKSHPGGALPLERYHGQDATDAFASLHSEDAWTALRRLKVVSVPAEVEEMCVPATPLTKAFREWRAELVKEGMFERHWGKDVMAVVLTLAFCVAGYALAWQMPLVAMVLLGVGMQQAGWIGHDYTHGRGGASWWLARSISGGINAFSPEWWSEKHNTHHVHPNQRGIDSDIENDPILHLHMPEEGQDVWFRQYQHIYYHFAFAFLYFSWRLQSFQTAWGRRNWAELAPMAINYALLAYLPLHVALGSILIGGWLVAEIVTATHQSEDFLDDMDHEFVRNQFITTRDVTTPDVVTEYLWGGMNYQLIHHLFPTMPRYRYPEMVPRMHAFAKANNIEYRTATMSEIWAMNYETMKKFSRPCEKKNL